MSNKTFFKISEVSNTNLELSNSVRYSSGGRPRLQFKEMSERSKRREASELSTKTGNETELLVQASIMSARKEGKRELAVVLKETMESPTRASKIKKLCTQRDVHPIALSDEEALAFFLENNLTKKQYCNIRVENKK